MGSGNRAHSQRGTAKHRCRRDSAQWPLADGGLLAWSFDVAASEKPSCSRHCDCGAAPGGSKDAATPGCQGVDRVCPSAGGGPKCEFLRSHQPYTSGICSAGPRWHIDAVIDSGETALGLESTVVDVCEDPPILYRPGMVTFGQVQSLCPSLVAYRESQDASARALPSPGVGLKHYAPRARLILAEWDTAELLKLAGQLRAEGEVIGIMMPGDVNIEPAYLIYRWGDPTDHEELARRLFAGLRELDAAGATVIICPLPPNDGLGVAVRDRLLKAAR
jgi:hypothetical protein